MVTMTGTRNDEGATLVHRWGWLLALGIVQIIAGGIAIAVPVLASLAAVGIFGAILIVTAIFQISHAFQVRAWPRSLWYGLGGVLYGLAGVLVVLFPIGGALTLAVVIAILLIADGVLRVVFAMANASVPGRGMMMMAGYASIAVGVILFLGWPASALWAIGLLLGINLIFAGLTNIVVAGSSRTAVTA